MFWPILYTVLTTIIAFLSLIFSEIKPIIDFGWMMTFGLITSFIITFTLLPTLLNFTPTKNISVKVEGSKGDEESEIINGRRSSSTSINNQSAKGSEKNTPTALKGEPTSTKKPVSKPNKGKGNEEDEEENKEKGER